MSIELENQIYPLSSLTNIDINHMTFKDIISLIFHAAKLMSKTDNEWQKYYENFLEDLAKQNKAGWPILNVNRNDYSKRIDIFTHKTYITSDNLFMLILRLLSIENFKTVYRYDTYKYHPILTHVIISNTPESNIKKLSIDHLLNLFKSHIAYYMKIYNDADRIEYQLGKTILNSMS